MPDAAKPKVLPKPIATLPDIRTSQRRRAREGQQVREFMETAVVP